MTANGSAAFNNYSGGADIGQALANGSVAVNGGVDELCRLLCVVVFVSSHCVELCRLLLAFIVTHI